MPHGVCDDAIAEQALFNGTLALLSIIFFTPHLFLYRSGPIILVLQKAKNSVKNAAIAMRYAAFVGLSG